MFDTAWAFAIVIAMQSGRPAAPVTADQWPDARPATHLFVNLFHDLKSLPSTNSAVVLGIGGVGAAAVRPEDHRLANWSAGRGASSYTEVGRVFGNGWVQSGGAVATYVVGRIWDRPQVIHIGSDLIRAQLLNGVVTTALKMTVDRARPNGGHYAFPSGHTSATFASAAVLHAHYGWRVGIPAFAAGGFVAWTRARDGAHWVSDVAFGTALGIVSGRTVAAPHTRHRLTLVPAPTRGGGSITFQINR